jgi:membrane-bound inhibitor of C-type lysozyme
MKIIWNKVTKLSQFMAIVLFVAVFFVGFFIGREYENKTILSFPINSVVFKCSNNKVIYADFYKNFVHIKNEQLGSRYLPQTISASGARYSDDNESIVFWNKGNTAFMTEGDPNTPTYKDCAF